MTMRLAALVLAVSALAACGGPDISKRTAAMEYYNNVASHEERTDASGADLSGQIERQRTIAREENGILHAYIDIKNLSSDTWHGEYRFVFYDGDGVEMTGIGSEWQSRAFNGRDVATLRGMAPKPGAKAFRLFIRGDAPIRR